MPRSMPRPREPPALVFRLGVMDAGGRRDRRRDFGRRPVAGVAIRPSRRYSSLDGQPNLEDLEIVASSDEGSADAMDMLQDDIEFYDWADKAANSGPAASG